MAGEMNNAMRLTPRQERFVELLLEGKSQREAYRGAYPNCQSSDKTVDEKACRLFKQGKISARFHELQERVFTSKSIASARAVLEELTGIGLGTAEFPSYDMFGNEYKRKPSVNERLKALELLGKNFKLFTDRVETNLPVTIVIKDDYGDGDQG